MTYKSDPIAEKLDKLAEATGLPRLSRRLERNMPIRFRIIPLILLAIALVGMGLQIRGTIGFGFSVILVSWSLALSFQQMSPLRHPTRGRHDEREAALVRGGHLVGLIWAFGVAVAGSLAIALGKIGAAVGLWDIWAPTTGVDWMAVMLFLLTVELNVALLAASAATPEPLADEDD